jgi:hypothetical protein
VNDTKPSKKEVAGSRQRVVDAMRALVGDMHCATEAEEEEISRGGGFDPNVYFAALDRLSLEPGYRLHYAYCANEVPSVYARREGMLRFLQWREVTLNLDEFTAAEHCLAFSHGNYGYTRHIQIADSEDGFFQFVVLLVMGGQFHLFWHALCHDETIVCTLQALRAVLRQPDDLGNPLPASLADQARHIDLAPVVKMGCDAVLVRVAEFSKWGGLLRRSYKIQRQFPHRILDMSTRELVPFDCGIMW